MTVLTSVTDQRYALRVAVEQATNEILDAIWEWDDDKIQRSYSNLREGSLSINWDLRDNDDIEPSR